VPTKSHINITIQRNEGRQCKASGCTNLRSRVSALCKKHTRTRHLYGHPLGRSIPLREYVGVSEEIAGFIVARREHPAIVAALRWIANWCIDSSTPAHRAMDRLHLRGVPTETILTSALAPWLYSHRRPSRLPDDLRLTYAISLAVLALAPRERRPSRSNAGRSYTARHTADVRRGVGERIRNNLSPLFANICIALERIEAEQRSHQDALRVPL
jgi:hypothetical protein